MFTSGFLEGNKSASVCVQVKIVGHSQTTVRAALEWIYEHRLSKHVPLTFEQHLDLLRFADQYQLTDLHECVGVKLKCTLIRTQEEPNALDKLDHILLLTDEDDRMNEFREFAIEQLTEVLLNQPHSSVLELLKLARKHRCNMLEESCMGRIKNDWVKLRAGKDFRDWLEGLDGEMLRELLMTARAFDLNI